VKGKDKHQLPLFWLYSKRTWTGRMLFLDWFHQSFVSEVRKYLASKGLPFNILLILDNAPVHPGPHEFNTKGVEVVYLPSNTMCLIQPLAHGVVRTFKAHYTQYFKERIVNTMKENCNREDIMKVWKNHTIGDAIVVIEKAMKAIKPQTIHSCWKNCAWMLCMTSQDLQQSQSRKS